MTPSRARRLVVDLAATAPSWALPVWGEDAIRVAAPPDWDVQFVRDLTVSDGDGGRAAGPEALLAAADAEVYFGHGLPRSCFRWQPGSGGFTRLRRGSRACCSPR